MRDGGSAAQRQPTELNRGEKPPPPALSAFGLDIEILASLPPDVRDRLLDYLREWGEAGDLMAAATLLRETHGPLLFLLDLEAEALLQGDEATLAVDVNERRQRRSSTIHGQAFEVRALLALGRSREARTLALDLAQTFPRSLVAQLCAVDMHSALGEFDAAGARLDEWLTAHPGDLVATLARAGVAHAAGQDLLAAAMADRLGLGVPQTLADGDLKRLSALLAALGRIESSRAVEVELEKRRLQQLRQLHTALEPFTSLDPALRADSAETYRRLNGPEAVSMTRAEQRRVELDAMRHFGFATLREGQTETIACVLRGESVLAIMPTGAGKSLCYQLPALTMPRATLIISPLIALMKDQVEGLPFAARARATFINSTISDDELQARMRGIADGRFKLVYAAPERLRQREFLRTLRAVGLDLFVVDEAHCVSLWGHDFRPDYLFLQEARRELGAPATLAITATAPPRVRDEILDYMALDEGTDPAQSIASQPVGEPAAEPPGQPAHTARPRVIALDVFRSNLHLSALRFDDEEQKRDALIHFVAQTPGSGIVYVNTRNKAEQLARALRQAGIAAEPYHAGLEDRAEIQDRFMSDATRVVVATVAFGMGIDKADIRFIVHFHPARSLAGYYQEVGRAGRDGKPGQGVLFFSANDWTSLRRWARADDYGSDFLQRVYAAIAAQLGVAEGELSQPVAGAVDARRLQQVLDVEETALRVAVSLLERADLLSRSFDVAQDVTVKLPRALPSSARKDADFVDLVRGLRLGPGQSGAFKLATIAGFMGWSLADCEGVLMDWQSAGYLTLNLTRRAMAISLPPRPDDLQARLERLLEQSQALAQRRIDDMAGYATTEGCRHGYISAQFGSPPRSRCRVCDNCTGVRPQVPPREESHHLLPDDADIQPMILDCLLSLPQPLGKSGLASVLAGSLKAKYAPEQVRHYGALKGLGEEAIRTYIDDLLETGRLRRYERRDYAVLGTTAAGRAEAEEWLAEHPEIDAAHTTEPAFDHDVAQEVVTPDAKVPYTALQRALWRWRKRLSEQLGQPPYVVMSNETLLQIAETRPAGIEALAALPGMGETRITRYGPAILDLVLLNPEQDGDAAALFAQRQSQMAERAAKATVRQAAPPPVSPRMEKIILMRLQEIRQRQAVSGRLKLTEVAPSGLLKEIARIAPATLDELDAVPGFRDSALRSEATQIVTFIAALRVGG